MLTFTIEKPKEISFGIQNVDLGADSYDRGYEEGEKAGYNSGYEIGVTEGTEAGYVSGKQEGYTEGYEIGAKEGAEVGYAKGKNDAEANAIALVNEGIAGCDLGIEEADSIEQIPEKIDEIYLTSQEQGFQSGKSTGYDEGKVDGAQNALDAVNGELIPRGLEGAETAEEIATCLDNAFEKVGQDSYKAGYDKGYEDGAAEGGTEDLNAVLTEQENLIATLQDTLRGKASGGGDSYYDTFWDAYQQNGTRTDYQNAFSGRGWTEETFKPKYDIIVTNTYMLFRYCGIKDLGEALKSAGVRLVIQQNQLSLTFNSTLLEVIDGVEFTTTFTSISQAFNYNSYLREIRVPIPVMETTSVDGFNGCNALEEVRFIGTIGKALDVHWSKNLSNASVQNIIDCLQDLTGTTAQKLTLYTAVVANMTEAQKTAVSSKNWTLVSSN